MAELQHWLDDRVKMLQAQFMLFRLRLADEKLRRYLLRQYLRSQTPNDPETRSSINLAMQRRCELAELSVLYQRFLAEHKGSGILHGPLTFLRRKDD